MEQHKPRRPLAKLLALAVVGLTPTASQAQTELPAAPGASNPQTTEDIERAKRALLVRPQLRAAEHVNPAAQPLSRVFSFFKKRICDPDALRCVRGSDWHPNWRSMTR